MGLFDGNSWPITYPEPPKYANDSLHGIRDRQCMLGSVEATQRDILRKGLETILSGAKDAARITGEGYAEAAAEIAQRFLDESDRAGLVGP